MGVGSVVERLSFLGRHHLNTRLPLSHLVTCCVHSQLVIKKNKNKNNH